MKKLNELHYFALGVCIILSVFFIGGACATLQPGADPFVVRVEQSLTMSTGAFDFILHTDQANRFFWKTNAPAFHAFCEKLRSPVSYNGKMVPMCIAYQLMVDDAKLVYKSAKTPANSNALYSVWSQLDTTTLQTTSWSNIVTARSY